MKKAILYLFGLTAGLVALGVAAFMVLNYWERILSYVTAGVRVSTNILKGLTGESSDNVGPEDYFSSDDWDI